MDRKEFIKYLASITATISLTGCLDSPDEPSPDNQNDGTTGDCGQNGTNATIAINHGHILTVSKEDVFKGVEKTYNIQGTSDHDHSVTVTAEQFADLQENRIAIVATTNNAGHNHEVSIVCA